MKLKAIKMIKNIRSFISFVSGHEFGNRNIIYAVNGLGKTNISRFLQYLSDSTDLSGLKSKEASSDSIEFQIITDDDKEIDELNYASFDLSNIIVFNSDFIEDNVRTDDWSAKEVDGKLEVELGEDQQKLTGLVTQRNSVIEKIENIKRSLENGLEEKLVDVKTWDPKNRKTLEKLVYENLSQEKYELFKSQEREFIDEKGKTCEGWENSKVNFDEIKDLDPDTDRISSNIRPVNESIIDFAWIEEQFRQSVTFTEPPAGELKGHIEKLSTDWIRVGLQYHMDDEDNCPFCRVKLSDDEIGIINKYQEHIDSMKTAFDDKCNEQIQKVETVIDELKKNSNNSKAIVELRAKNLNLDYNWNDLDTSKLGECLERLNLKLQQKKKAPDEILIIDDRGLEGLSFVAKIKRDVESLNEKIQENNSFITTINQKLTGVATRQTELRELLGKEYVVEFYEAHNDIIEERGILQKNVSSLEEMIKEAQKALPSIDAAENIVDIFNTFVQQIGIHKYSAEMKDGKIILKLEEIYDISTDADKLVSEGEKNAIALCYFLASSIRKLNSSEKFSQAVFVIDDPICSMNYKYFYGACSVLKNYPKIIQRILKGSESAPCPQLFLLTHNIQLFNMISSNVFKKDACYFELEMNLDGHTLRKLSDEEKLSDFQTALRRIKGCANRNHNENIGNDIRRVLETLCRFHGYGLDIVGSISKCNTVSTSLSCQHYEALQAPFCLRS